MISQHSYSFLVLLCRFESLKIVRIWLVWLKQQSFSEYNNKAVTTYTIIVTDIPAILVYPVCEVTGLSPALLLALALHITFSADLNLHRLTGCLSVARIL